MLTDINHISWEGTFRIWFEEHCTGIWWEGLPADVHFTLSHRPQDNYVNLHVTRNYGDPRNKPKIEIARLNKEACKTMLESFDAVFHKHAWTKLKLNFSKIRNNRSSTHYFLLLDDLQKQKQFSKFRNNMSLAFLKSSKIKQKRRLKILKTIEQEMEQLIIDPSLQKTFYKSLRKLPLIWTNKPQAAILVSKEYSGCVIMTNEGVFEFNRSALPEILSSLIQPDLYAALNSFIPLAIQQVSIAKTYKDTEHLDNPVQLQLVKSL